MQIDRSEVNRALAKAIAYKQVGNDAEAEQWALRLLTLLGLAGIVPAEKARKIADAGTMFA